MDPWQIGVAFVFVAAACLLSASAGMGGSLILVPTLALLLGPKEGVATAALLLGANNVFKVAAYRRTIPWRAASGVLALTVAGASLGAALLVAVPEAIVDWAIIGGLIVSFVVDVERIGGGDRGDAAVDRGDRTRGAGVNDDRAGADLRTGGGVHGRRRRPGAAALCALTAGACSGFSGTSGPLKGVTLRNLGTDRFHLLGAASLVSLAADLTKASVFVSGDLVTEAAAFILIGALPLMPLAALTGRRINQAIGERAYAGLFWAVMAGYSIRLLVV